MYGQYSRVGYDRAYIDNARTVNYSSAGGPQEDLMGFYVSISWYNYKAIKPELQQFIIDVHVFEILERNKTCFTKKSRKPPSFYNKFFIGPSLHLARNAVIASVINYFILLQMINQTRMP